MHITIDNDTITVPFDYKSISALFEKYGVKSLTEVEKIINKVSYATAHKMVGELLRAGGHEVTDEQVLDAIQESHFPMLLIDALNTAIMGPKAEEAKQMAEDIAAGN